MSNPTGLEGTVLLDGKADHQGTVVKVTQGSTVKTVTTSSNGSYQVTGLVPGSCTVEYDNENARWKKVTKNATIISDQMIQMPLVTLYIGDMNSDNMINLQDLLDVRHRQKFDFRGLVDCQVRRCDCVCR